MNWLLPQVSLPSGRAKSVGEPNKRAAANAASRKWRRSAKGLAWRERFREQRRAYDKRWYATSSTRREYLARKKRERRLKCS